MSRAITFSGASNNARPLTTRIATKRAIGSNHMYAQSTLWRVTRSTPAKATDCSRKWVSALPTFASGRIARGNLTLPTSDEFAVIETVAVSIAVDAKVHTSSPHSTQMANRGNPAPRIANTAV